MKFSESCDTILAVPTVLLRVQRAETLPSAFSLKVKWNVAHFRNFLVHILRAASNVMVVFKSLVLLLLVVLSVCQLSAAAPQPREEGEAELSLTAAAAVGGGEVLER